MADSGLGSEAPETYMKTILMRLEKGNCRIFIGRGILRSLGLLCKKDLSGRRPVIISNPSVKKIFGAVLEKTLDYSDPHFLTVPDSEKSKSSRIAMGLIEKITEIDAGKEVFLAALGGGVVGDLTGFAAAIYKRGIPYIQIPTTLLAQIDSSIGGKTAIDTPFGKNLVGAFYQPTLVVSDVNCLSTLPQKELRAGLSEAVKYALISGKKLYGWLKQNSARLLRRDIQCLQFLVETCAAIKSSVVQKDEFDKKDRRIVLNFGHTAGHAIEAASRFRLSHGEAISIGMVCACDLSERLGLLKPGLKEDVIHLLEDIGLPTRAPERLLPQALKALAYDKKFRSGKKRFVLLTGLGKTTIAENIPWEMIRKALKARLSRP